MQPSEYQNRLLAQLPPADLEHISAHLEAIDLPRGFQISAGGISDSHSYFLERGIGSIVAMSPERQASEIGLFGRDGVWVTAVLLEAGHSPHDVFVQAPGNGYRLANDVLKPALASRPVFRSLLLRFMYTLFVQTSYTALSNAVHHVDERLARWLLMCHDRAETDELALTHEFLSLMLSVRRPSVTTGLHVLARNRLIHAQRGLITIRDRIGLEAFAGDAYGVPEREYLRLLGPMRGA